MLTAVRKTLRHFSESGKLFGGNCDPDCPGRYFVDRFIHLQKDADLHVDRFLDICHKWRINAVIPTRDGELAFFARQKEHFAKAGIRLLIGDLQAIEICLDKLAFAEQSQPLGFSQAIPTSADIKMISADALVVKERYGSGAKGQRLNISRTEAIEYAATLKEPIFQPYIDGQEFSIDLYLDRKNRLLGAISRSRDLIINGEAQISTTINDEKLEHLCSTIAKQLQLSGHLVFQAIIDNQQKIHVIECNCRIGGASTLSFAAGLQSLLWFFCEATGQDPRQYPFIRAPRPLRQVRHPADIIIEMPHPASGNNHE